MALASNALTTYETARVALGLSIPADTDEAAAQRTRIEFLINAASAAIANYCNRLFEFEAGEVEEVKGQGVNRIVVRRTPVRSIQAIQLLSFDRQVVYTYDPWTYACNGLDAESGIITRNISGVAMPPALTGSAWLWSAEMASDIAGSPLAGSERKILRVIYDGGWVTPAQVDTDNAGFAGQRDLPFDLEHACIQTVASMSARYGQNMAITSATLHQSSISYASGSASIGSLPAEVQGSLASYRRWM